MHLAFELAWYSPVLKPLPHEDTIPYDVLVSTRNKIKQHLYVLNKWYQVSKKWQAPAISRQFHQTPQRVSNLLGL